MVAKTVKITKVAKCHMRTFSGEELRRSKQVAVVFSPLVGGKISAIFDRQVQAPKGVFTDTPPPPMHRARFSASRRPQDPRQDYHAERPVCSMGAGPPRAPGLRAPQTERMARGEQRRLYGRCCLSPRRPRSERQQGEGGREEKEEKVVASLTVRLLKS